MSLSQAEADQIRSGVATRQLVQAARPDLLLLPVQSLLPPPGHHRMGHRESLRRIHPARPARRTTPAHRRCAATTSGTPCTSRYSSGWSASASSGHRPCRTHTRRQRGRYRTARTACPVRRAVHNRHPNAAGPTTAPAARHRACGTPASRPVLIFGSSTVNPRQRPGQHLVPGPAQLGERTPPGLVEDDLRIGAHTAALVPHGGVAACPQPQHARGRQAVTRRRSMDQRRGQLPGQRHDP
ncbi:hypothetical protein AB0P05_45280 [Streptomyces flaveolus]|uniref:hypothetical protein n=1 Tax=Streptomyces flaveolus TaxID=67297 RepID=UPI003428B8E2